METREEVLLQYRDANNLNARIAFHKRFATNPQSWSEWVFDQFDFPTDAAVLELGAGPGGLWIENVDRIPAGWQITLSDLSPGMLDEQQRGLSGAGRVFKHEVVDAMDIPFADATFDAVIANHMLYHVPDRPKAFAEIQRVLKSGGLFYAATNGAAHLRELRDLTERFAPDADIWGSFFTMLNFTLESGAEEMAAWFPNAEVRRQGNHLHVTEAEPLVAYVLSAVDQKELPAERVPAFRQFVQQEIESANGVFVVKRDSGLFVARKPT